MDGDVVAVLVPVLMLGGAVAVGTGTARTHLRRRRAWRSGRTAEARCVRSWTTTHTSSGGPSSASPGTTTTTHHHVYEFRPPGAGKPVRFEEEDGPPDVVQGDVVTVFYDPARPPGATAVAPGRKALWETVLGLAVSAGVAAFALSMLVSW